MTESDLRKLSTFHTKSLKRTFRLFWPKTISNQDLLVRCQQEDMATNIFRRRWNWIGQVLRRDPDSFIKTALFWTLGGGRMEAEIKEQKRTWAHSKQPRMENHRNCPIRQRCHVQYLGSLLHPMFSIVPGLNVSDNSLPKIMM